MVERINKLIAQYGGGLTITELERRLGFSRGSIAKWDISLPNIERVDKVAKFFGVSIDYLQNGAEKEAATNGSRIDLDSLSPAKAELFRLLMETPDDQVVAILQLLRSLLP